MKQSPMVPKASTFPHVRDSPTVPGPLNLATRYLCMAPYLRRAMLPKVVNEPNTVTARPPLPVGRKYALRVLYGGEGKLPMPGIQIDSLRHHCHASLVEASLRDAAAVATVLAAAFLAPLGTLVTLLTFVAAVVFIRRVRPLSLPFIAAATGAVVALVWGWRSTQEPYAVPLISVAICFLIYLGDISWSMRQIKKLSQQPPPPQVSAPDSTGILIFPSDILAVDQDRRAEFTAISQQGAKVTPVDSNVYYDKDGIIGGGASSTPFPLTIPLDQPRDDDHEAKAFTASDLLEHIKRNVTSQGVGDDTAHGLAYRPGSANGGPHLRATPHFTYGLPDLKVDTVRATPFPGTKEHPILRFGIVRLDTGHTVAEERSPSAHPDRRYVRAVSVSWDGQLVVSLYASAALQGHYLHIMIRPYILAPIVSELKSADKLVKRHLLMRACAAIRLTVREFASAAKYLRDLTGNPRERVKYKDPRPTGRSTRERYALRYLENMHQDDDAQRIIRIVERKIVAVTVDYLHGRNISTGEFEAQIITNIENHVIGGGAIFSGTFTGPVAAATGTSATATAQGNAPANNNPSTK